jgi:hypothetical protein
MSRFSVRTRPVTIGSILVLAIVASTAPAVAAERWSIVLTTAPHLPQDIWFSAMGDNTDGWRGGGSICLNQLAQGFPNGEQLTLLVDVVEAGIFGVDGSPVPAGTYTFPGIELPSFDYTVAANTTFYVSTTAYVAQSKPPAVSGRRRLRGEPRRGFHQRARGLRRDLRRRHRATGRDQRELPGRRAVLLACPERGAGIVAEQRLQTAGVSSSARR